MNFLTVTDNAGGGQEKKKALSKSAGGQDMVYLFKHIGKVPDAAIFDACITMIHVGITAKTNQAMMRYKLFKICPKVTNHSPLGGQKLETRQRDATLITIQRRWLQGMLCCLILQMQG